MAIRPDWTSGTLTLVAGSKDFTTTGSALETAALQVGDAIITVSGYVLIIEAITGQNSGTLYAECPMAAAGSDQPLRIRYQPDGSRVQGAMRMVRELLTSGNLEAFAALAGEEDAVPVFVGPGVIKLVPKSEFGPDDTKSNLAAVAQLDSIANLTELALLAKANEQFVVMDANGKIAIVPFKQFTDEIAKKFQLPEGGSEQQLISGTGGLIEPATLPVSTATQDALDLKATTALVGSKSSYNWIINGDFTINQRGGGKKPANGVYGFDRWKGHANGIEQIVEALPAGEYTLTWSGGGNGTFGGQTQASPIKATVSGGNTSVVVPQTATMISVVSGDLTTKDPWSARHKQQEQLLCDRYYQTAPEVWMGMISTSAYRRSTVMFRTIMRASPTCKGDLNETSVALFFQNISEKGAILAIDSNIGTQMNVLARNITFDAEI
ncbi:hypothetical protein [Pseudochrobactrum kiredjianiae]|uniref:DUF2793 domain-containing protein n=1 Tax=Pseudochrobactrum kiredjianiae TaxID=386305 RepID=A0ABW3V0S2_9HYPH|nr:hypothetical protein [Pseudochrobactrum kiredjianiae]MDM7851875.1 hypothetical protein [Pseudochrobactrum kiredjianiae]